MLVNVVLVLVARLLLGAGALDLSATFFFVLLVSLLVTMHDRYAPVAAVRAEHDHSDPEPAAPVPATPPGLTRPRPHPNAALRTGTFTFAPERFRCEREGSGIGRESWDEGQIWAVASWPSSSGARRSIRIPPRTTPTASRPSP